MTKLAVLLIVLGLGLYLLRRRVAAALKVGVVLYLVVIIVRIVQSADEERHIFEFGVSLGMLAAVWLLLWAAFKVVDVRRERARSLERKTKED